jgi:ribosomal protein S18 acetylase RimI-like enzyme|tara:strand:+ start:2789 stop:3133 length:345 start_codon:yes stop_codon:yes gene_type:complete
MGDDFIDSYHFGAYNLNSLVGGVTIINNKCKKMKIENCYQMRGLCVDDSFQNRGIGKKLVKKVEEKLKKLKIDNVWMNARESAIQFYLNLNYTNTNIKYSIGQIGLHFLMYKKL